MSFVVTPLCSNASELVSSLIFAAKKKKENISMTFAQVKFMVDENFSKWNNSDNFCTLHFSCMVLEPWTTLCALAFLLLLCTSGIWSGTTLQVRKMSNDSQLFFFILFVPLINCSTTNWRIYCIMKGWRFFSLIPLITRFWKTVFV